MSALRALIVTGMVAAGSSPASAADAVTFWNETAITTAAVHAGRPPAAVFVDLAYVHAAVYDAVVAIRGGYQPYAVAIENAPPGASAEAAVATAAHRVLITMFRADSAYLDARYALSLGSIPDGAAKDDGIAVGEQAAAGLLAARAGDGWNAPISYVPQPGPGHWQPTPPAFAPAISPWMAVMRPFTFDTGSAFRAEPPPALDSAQWAEDYNETQLFGAANSPVRTQEQTEIGRFYAEHTGIQYARIFREFASLQGLELADAARLFAMLYVTGADALIACWDSKYFYGFWRPVTAIRAGDTDGNPLTDPDLFWTPLAPTPGHPEYPAAHGTFTAAIAETLSQFFGSKKVTITLTSTVAGSGAPRTFESTVDMIHEIVDARVYGGMHYRTSGVRGVVLGKKVANWVLKHYFHPVQ
jgi:PAP2 superfamily